MEADEDELVMGLGNSMEKISTMRYNARANRFHSWSSASSSEAYCRQSERTRQLNEPNLWSCGWRLSSGEVSSREKRWVGHLHHPPPSTHQHKESITRTKCLFWQNRSWTRPIAHISWWYGYNWMCMMEGGGGEWARESSRWFGEFNFVCCLSVAQRRRMDSNNYISFGRSSFTGQFRDFFPGCTVFLTALHPLPPPIIILNACVCWTFAATLHQQRATHDSSHWLI